LHEQAADLPSLRCQFFAEFLTDIPLVSRTNQVIVDFREGAERNLDMAQVESRTERASPFHEVGWDGSGSTPELGSQLESFAGRECVT
jgi:hypothetical protein